MTARRGPDRDARKRLGTRGEQWAAEALQARGFEIVATNLRSRWGELDLVARRDGALWLVEVKTRRTGAFGPVEVSSHQQHRLTRMAYRFLQQLKQPFDTVQFVVAAVTFVDGKPQIEWIERAFDGAF